MRLPKILIPKKTKPVHLAPNPPAINHLLSSGAGNDSRASPTAVPRARVALRRNSGSLSPETADYRRRHRNVAKEGEGRRRCWKTTRRKVTKSREERLKCAQDLGCWRLPLKSGHGFANTQGRGEKERPSGFRRRLTPCSPSHISTI